jgi:hypothetical protein
MFPIFNRLEERRTIFRGYIDGYCGARRDRPYDRTDWVSGAYANKNGRIRRIGKLERETAAGQANRQRSDIARSTVNWVRDGAG